MAQVQALLEFRKRLEATEQAAGSRGDCFEEQDTPGTVLVRPLTWKDSTTLPHAMSQLDLKVTSWPTATVPGTLSKDGTRTELRRTLISTDTDPRPYPCNVAHPHTPTAS